MYYEPKSNYLWIVFFPLVRTQNKGWCNIGAAKYTDTWFCVHCEREIKTKSKLWKDLITDVFTTTPQGMIACVICLSWLNCNLEIFHWFQSLLTQLVLGNLFHNAQYVPCFDSIYRILKMLYVKQECKASCGVGSLHFKGWMVNMEALYGQETKLK